MKFSDRYQDIDIEVGEGKILKICLILLRN
ncbi:hypothetical protein SAMN04488530_101199 [Asaccharospora irregularis DSM 2635]|uniref:Uncharacterized protein n=1 Tax=Asaccharospora irregularis DSM 2635 TaxID=1121321 RepID=A0A1M5JL23_9FIRM|nr:hypothetical protein SAMN04488530_101199 [Asaccharospora irregularis DSM 2635]